MRKHFRLVLVLPLAALVLAACDQGGSGGISPLDPSLGISAATSAAVDSKLESEKRRIAQEQEKSKKEYDKLKREWERFLKNGPKGKKGSFVMCDPQQYTGQAKVVGPEGGDVDFGPHKLSIPKGALAVPTVITAEAPVTAHVEGRFGPHGLVFLKPATLTLSYKHCVGIEKDAKRTAYHVNNVVLEHLATADDHAGLARSPIKHFSDYALIWP